MNFVIPQTKRHIRLWRFWTECLRKFGTEGRVSERRLSYELRKVETLVTKNAVTAVYIKPKERD